jgi:hypothetical protein
MKAGSNDGISMEIGWVMVLLEGLRIDALDRWQSMEAGTRLEIVGDTMTVKKLGRLEINWALFCVRDE